MIDHRKVINWFKKKGITIVDKFWKRKDFYVCRVCHSILSEEEMSEDKSICEECSKH